MLEFMDKEIKRRFTIKLGNEISHKIIRNNETKELLSVEELNALDRNAAAYDFIITKGTTITGYIKDKEQFKQLLKYTREYIDLSIPRAYAKYSAAGHLDKPPSRLKSVKGADYGLRYYYNHWNKSKDQKAAEGKKGGPAAG